MMSYMTAPSLVPHHQQQQQQPPRHQATPSASFQEWLKAWKSWAGTRKRGKMAQFIVQKLEENKQAKWLDITVGKFELTEWHRIAEEWFKEKPRNSDQVDAPCMLRKGLPRAFPGLDEVKGESIKEGTQYRSRVFQAPPTLVQEVQLYVSKPMMYPTSAVGPDMSSYSGHMAMQMSYPQTSNGPSGYNYAMAGGMHSPGSIRMKPDPDPILDVGGSPSSSDTASPYTYANYDGMFNGGGMVAPPMITDSPVAANDVLTTGNGHHSPYRGQSPYSMESTSPAHNQPTPTPYHTQQQMLQVPTSAGVGVAGVGVVGDVDVWSNGSTHNSPRYSPDSNYPQDMSQQPLSPPMMMPSQLSPGPAQQVLVDVKAYPDQSPLEGGGQLALLFSGQLPPGPKWLSFISQTRPEYVHQVEAIENNAIALTTIIPKHDIPETMNLQVVCGGQVFASTEFTYYANAQYHSDLLFQYLTHTFPSYFPDVGGAGGGMGGAMGQDGGEGLGGGYGGFYGGNIPSTSYSLLLGACRLGIEPLIYATLELPSMININRAQLTRAKELAEENGHVNAAKVLGIIADMENITIKGGEGEEEEGNEHILGTEKSKEALSQLDNVKDNLKAGGQKILDYLAKIHKMEQRVKDEGERDSDHVPSSPTVYPSSPTPQTSGGSVERSDSTSGEGRRRLSANKLTRQDESVREDDEPPQSGDGTEALIPPTQIHSRASISEQDDQLPPLRPSRSLRSKGGLGMRKMLIASHSDAADSAVSMSFDEQDHRRGSASLASTGLYSLNNSVSQQLLNITIQAKEGETYADSLQYECVYQVMEDFPPNSDSSNVMLKCGDRIIQVGDQLVRDKGPDEFAELWRHEAARGTTVKILSPTSAGAGIHSIASSIGYSSLDVAERKQLIRRQSDRDVTSSLTTKVSNLLTMKASIYPRSVTVPYVAGEGWGFELTGGNAVGIFISKVSSSRKELQVGDQVLQLGGQDAVAMSHYEATCILRSSKDKIQLRVAENIAKYTAIKDQFELESYYICSHVDHTPSDSKDMMLKKGSIVRVVNTVLFPGYWLAWSVDPNTGMDLDLRRIPSPSSAKQIHGKDIYEAVNSYNPSQNISVISAS